MSEAISSHPVFSKRIVLTLLFLSVSHIVCIVFSVEVPLFLLYGPVLFYFFFFLKYGRKRKDILYLAASPFSFFIIVKTVSWWSSSLWSHIQPFYSVIYLLLSATALIIPAIMILKKVTFKKYRVNGKEFLLVCQLSLAFIALGLTVLFLIATSFWNVDSEIDPLYMVLGILLLCSFVLIQYLLKVSFSNFKPENKELEGGKFPTKEVVFFINGKEEIYYQKVQDYLKSSQAFLNPNLSLALLSDAVNIPRHHLSELFNTYLGKTFYILVAEYRIQYFKDELLHKDWTIDALANACGFNSTNTFNKYFKEITGLTPREYKNKECKNNG